MGSNTMNTKTTLSLSDARKKIFDIAKDVQKPDRHYTLTDKGRPRVVIMSAEQYESWAETLEVVNDFPDLEKDIKETRRAIESGEYKRWTTFEELLNREGFAPVSGSLKKNALSHKDKTARRKRAR